MGIMKKDIHKNFRDFEQTYKIETLEGTVRLLENLNQLKAQKRFGSIEATILLIDLEDAIEKANLSKREKETLHLRYDRQCSLKETAKELSISLKTVHEYEKRAIEKIAAFARYIWEDDEDGL